MKDRFQVLLLVLVLTGVGALVASFWLEWREPRLADNTPATLEEATAAEQADVPSRLRVEVLNGTGDRGAARQVAMRLRELGFDVVYFGNAPTYDHTFSRVVNRSGQPGIARLIADSIGADSVATDVDPDLFLDATVLLGSDWRRFLEGR